MQAELGTVQLEFRYLSYHTGDSSFREKAENVYNALKGKDNDGIYPTKVGSLYIYIPDRRLCVRVCCSNRF